MNRVTYHVNDGTKKYFFSTVHCQDVPDSFVPVTNYRDSKEEVKAMLDEYGYKEIENPDKNYQG